MIAKTNIYNRYQTVIPKEIRKKINIDKEQIIEWDINDKGKVELTFRKKLTTKDMIGRYTTKKPINATNELKKMERGEY
ncbi:type II toxin-antitoxin system PrlF family antitoxin [Methanobrevibacter sp. TMH8]|uniref:AbrB/MazE/SpoVT family DNA-binding domain-containing protein n=1 Tax=Methanobrevibacter sp. TMH8 TaxID=2848611 RepID=UPI001CCE97E9|nr:AbrB/MazE/SpoVT family DNA-binding domain-containing protein [Methanobrevibacter sp. TMH8]MBZ9570633.1 type II toxin-antitoxin system PrlF family antitoxin [Methanobrevibacter sp. TMH8]